MKIAITSCGDQLESKIDKRFGRCAFFAVYDTETRETEFVKNPGAEALEGAGPASLQLLAPYEVEKIISGEFGIKVKPLIDSMKIQMIIYREADKTIQDIINLIHN